MDIGGEAAKGMHDSNADLLKRGRGSDRAAPRSTPSEPGIESVSGTMRSGSATDAISNTTMRSVSAHYPTLLLRFYG